MTLRPLFVLFALLPVTAGTAVAAGDVVPKAGVALTGAIKFPREQQMTLETGAQDGAKLIVRMGFDGKCTGGGLQEVWASTILAEQSVRVRDGRFSADLTGTSRNLGGVSGRTGEFKWTLSGRFLAEDSATATVSGSAKIKKNGRVFSRCKIAGPTSVRLAVR
jgi:hypothetical protein